MLVGADGVNGRIARDAGLGGGILYGIALEGNGPLPAGQPGRATVELGVVPGGYGWVFPKADHANYGVGGWAAEGPRLRTHLHRLCAEHGVDAARLTDVQGRRLPIRRTTSAARGPVLLVGDAAGLVDPLSGDGIYEALVSARLAAAAILDGEPRPLRGRAARGARPLRGHVLEGEARARPTPAGGLRDRTHPAGLARDRRTAQRRGRAPERCPRPGTAAAAPAGAPLKKRTKPADSSPRLPMDLNAILRIAVELGASDIHLKLDQPPMLRTDGVDRAASRLPRARRSRTCSRRSRR